MKYVDPQVQSFLDMIAQNPGPPLRDIPIEEMRSAYSALLNNFQVPAKEIDEIKNITIPGPGGDIQCKLCIPVKTNELLPILIYYHGGGCVNLSPEEYVAQSTVIADAARCQVLIPDFRNAPEAPFPAALNDSYTVFKWVQEFGETIGADPEKIALAGDSGGGYLTCAVTHEAKRQNRPQPVLQIPIYPVTDQAAITPSRLELDYFANSDDINYIMAELYAQGNIYNPQTSPLRESDFTGLAPAYVITAGLDPMRDEGFAYAVKLRQAGVPTFYHCYEHMIHGFISLGKVLDVGVLALHHIAGALRQAFDK